MAVRKTSARKPKAEPKPPDVETPEAPEAVGDPASPLPPVPDHMVRVHRSATDSGRDHRLISKAQYDADPKAYKLYS